MAKRIYDSAKEKILDAAEDIVLRDGATALTLEAAAREAAVSKSGLIYHFPSKEKLLEALMKRLTDTWLTGVEEHAALIEPGPYLRARAMLSLYFSDSIKCKRCEQVFAALSAAKAHQPKFMSMVRKTYRRFLKEFEDEGGAWGKSLIVMAALDGLWWGSVIGFYSLNKEQEKLLREELENLVALPKST